jgi:hypothetical protein
VVSQTTCGLASPAAGEPVLEPQPSRPHLAKSRVARAPKRSSYPFTSDHETPVDLLVGIYARRWRVENGIAVVPREDQADAIREMRAP